MAFNAVTSPIEPITINKPATNSPSLMLVSSINARNTSDNLRGFGGGAGTTATGFASLIGGSDGAASIGREIVGFTGDFVGFGEGDKGFEDLGFTRGSDGFGNAATGLGTTGLATNGFISSVWEDSESLGLTTGFSCSTTRSSAGVSV